MPSPGGNKWGDVFEIDSLFKKFFLFFLKNRLRFGIPIPNKWRDKIILRFRGCIWLFSVGISEGTFWASRIKALNQKIFFKIFVKTGCVSASQFQISEGVLQTAKYFLKQGWNLPVPSGNKWRDFFGQVKISHPATGQKIFSHFFCEIGCHLALQFQISEEVFALNKKFFLENLKNGCAFRHPLSKWVKGSFVKQKIFQKYPIILLSPVGTSERTFQILKYFSDLDLPLVVSQWE